MFKFLGKKLSSATNMKLRAKLLLSFALLAVLIGLAGGSGLYSVNKIDGAVGVFTETAAPMMEETAGLVNGMRTMHVTLLNALGRDSGYLTEWANGFGNLHGLKVDKETGWVYIADTENNRIQVFKPVS